MKWYYQIQGGHTHVRVFMNGGKCGDLCFRNEEFAQIKDDHLRNGGPLSHRVIMFIEDTVPL